MISLSELKKFRIVQTDKQVDTICQHLVNGGDVILSFSNTWNDHIIATLNDDVIFHDSVSTDKSTGVSDKSFRINKENDSVNYIYIYMWLIKKYSLGLKSTIDMIMLRYIKHQVIL